MHKPIGIFDSGVGGLTVVRAIRQVLPERTIVYLGDTARVPYGSKSPRTVERYALACQRFLLDREVELVLVACNTASATALDALRAHAQVPVIGAVNPGAEAAIAATDNGHIGVIGTLATVRSGAYEAAIRARQAEAVVTTLACPLLVPLAEEGWTSDQVAHLVVRRYLAQLFARDRQIDTLVLGCTHYPLLRQTLAAAADELVAHAVTVVDSATAMAAAAKATLAPVTSGRQSRGQLQCYVTDSTRLDELAPRFLGEAVDEFHIVDL